MTEPIENGDEQGSREENNGPPAVEAFHERNREHKRNLFRLMAQGAAVGGGKEIGEKLADHYDLAGHVLKFIEWLHDNMF